MTLRWEVNKTNLVSMATNLTSWDYITHDKNLFTGLVDWWLMGTAGTVRQEIVSWQQLVFSFMSFEIFS